jgi:hypothetical protein
MSVPIWLLVVLVLAALGLVFLVFVIWNYPKDGSF